MDLWPRSTNRMMDDYFRDFNRFKRSHFPYWRNADHSVLHVANEAQQMVNDDSKFAVSLDVSHFRPEELKVHLEGKELTIEGKHQHKNDTSFIERSFVRKWMLPENVDLEALRTQLNDAGHLSVEAPKVGHTGAQKRSIPIERIPSHL
uniref:SHSP domain-containing protein n=1 Tax=Angiostrongylus cantonensis TaxID=6313 RepID=A0A0K0CYZ2_ANGCA